MKSCKIFGFALIISLMTTGVLCTATAIEGQPLGELTEQEQKGIDLALQDWTQSRGLHHSLDQILAKIAAEERAAQSQGLHLSSAQILARMAARTQAAQSQANNNGDSSDGRETAAAPSIWQADLD